MLGRSIPTISKPNQSLILLTYHREFLEASNKILVHAHTLAQILRAYTDYGAYNSFCDDTKNLRTAYFKALRITN